MSVSQTSDYALPLSGKVAFITGGTRGIGRGIALDLAKRGADIIITHTQNSVTLADELIQEITSLPHHPRCHSIIGNLSEVETPTQIVHEVKVWFNELGRDPKVNILVNNAAVEVVKSLAEITPDDYSKAYDVNVRSVIFLTQALLPLIPPKSRVINISSVGARAGFKALSLYCSSKAALEGLTRCWAAELGVNGTTVNVVEPGPVESEMLANIPEDIVQRQKDTTPIENRVGTIEEIAGVVGFLAGPDSAWVTGQTLSVSGGWAMY